VQKAEPYALAAFLNRMSAWPRSSDVGGDLERGASMRRFRHYAFPTPCLRATGSLAHRFEGEVTAREVCALGVHWVYYPGPDVNSIPTTPS